jgi:pyruvate dehydrogenase E1 component alpha subunit
MPEQDKSEEKTRLIKAYTAIVLSRTLDNKIVVSQRQGRVGFYTPTIGQEALQVGASMALQDKDLIYGYYRDVPLMLHRGVPMENIINQIMGNREDSALGRQMPSHYCDKKRNFMSVQSPVATNLPLAVGSAYTQKYRKTNSIVLTTFGEGSTSAPDFHAALNLAAVYNLPVIFLCENNGWAISMPVEKQTLAEIWTKASAYGMRGVRANGNDLLETYEVTREAVKRAREGKGPTLIDAVSFRMGPHSTSDDPTKYRDVIVEEGSDKDPVIITEKLLKSKGYIDDKFIESIKTRAEKIVNDKFEECAKIPAADPSSAFTGVYKESSWMLDEEVKDLL